MLSLPEKALPVYPRHKAPRVSGRVPERVTALKTWRDRRALELDLDPGLMLSKALMQAIALRHPQSLADLSEIADLRHWRRHTFGRDIVEVMQQVR